MSSPVPAIGGRRPHRFRWLPRNYSQLLAALVLLLLLVALVCYLLARMTPSWYVPLDASSDRAIDLADSAQSKFELGRGATLHNALENVPNGEQSWSITQDEINSLLALKSGSLQVKGPMVIFTPGKIILAARNKQIPGSHPDGGVFSVVFTIETLPVGQDSQLPTGVIKIKSAWLGNLPVPKFLVERQLPDLSPRLIAEARRDLAVSLGSTSKAIPQVETALRAVLQGEPFPVRFVYDHRPIVVKEVRVEEGSLTIIFAPADAGGRAAQAATGGASGEPVIGMDRKEIAAVMMSAGLRPQHHFGQNFMVDQKVLAAIADAGEIQPEDVILEVGPGVGNLTRQLATRANKGAVLAVDIDRKLMPAAQRHHADLKNVTWLNADVLAGKHEIEPAVLVKLRELRAAHPGGSLKLVSNLPYNAASPLIAELLVEMWREQVAQPPSAVIPLAFTRMAFTVQWEVGRRIVALPDTRDYGPLGIIIQSMTGPPPGGVRIVRKIPAGAFWPPPKIQSALVVLAPDAARVAALTDAPELQTLLSGIFSHRRQTLGNALKHHLGDAWTQAFKDKLAETGFDLNKRPETFSVDQFLRLQQALGRFKPE